MTKSVTVRWEVTEQHQHTFEVDDDFEDEEEIGGWLAEVETGETYEFTSDRSIVEVAYDTNDTKDN